MDVATGFGLITGILAGLCVVLAQENKKLKEQNQNLKRIRRK